MRPSEAEDYLRAMGGVATIPEMTARFGFTKAQADGCRYALRLLEARHVVERESALRDTGWQSKYTLVSSTRLGITFRYENSENGLTCDSHALWLDDSTTLRRIVDIARAQDPVPDEVILDMHEAIWRHPNSGPSQTERMMRRMQEVNE